MPEESEKRTNQKVISWLLALMGLIAFVQLGITIHTGYSVFTGAKQLEAFSTSFAVFTMILVLTMMGATVANMEAYKR